MGWCENCGTSPLSQCCPPENTYGCVDGKGCKCHSYGGGNGGCTGSLFEEEVAVVKEEVAVAKEEVALEAEAEVTGECYCSCCGWCHMTECYNGYNCCGGSDG